MDTILWEEESDNYTQRAMELLKGNLFHGKSDSNFICNAKVLEKFICNPSEALDIGCAYGGTINNLMKTFKDTKFYGIDPGKESIKIAEELINSDNALFSNGYSHDLPYSDNKFDLIIITNVLQWIPRKYLIRTISEIDRVLKDNGIIFLMDFLPNKPITSKSKHNNKISIFKDDYSTFFTAYSWFKEVYREISKIEDGEDQQRVLSFIKKYPLENMYSFKDGAVENNK